MPLNELPFLINHQKNRGKNIKGINFTEMEQAKITAAHFHLPQCNKYKLQTRKKIITPSKWRFPVSSIIINGFTVEKFQKYLQKLFLLSKDRSDIVLINAWNEWGEGMYLEPDKENEYAVLESLSIAVSEYF